MIRFGLTGGSLVAAGDPSTTQPSGEMSECLAFGGTLEVGTVIPSKVPWVLLEESRCPQVPPGSLQVECRCDAAGASCPGCGFGVLVGMPQELLPLGSRPGLPLVSLCPREGSSFHHASPVSYLLSLW